MGHEKPLVSLCLKFYRQKAFCEAALYGAFAQTYSPLEIIVSDDGSGDGTAEQVDAIVAQYRVSVPKDRQHSIVVVHNKKNMGSARTVEWQFRHAKGELLFQADGDDVSLPERVEKVVDAWLASGRKAGLIVCDAIELFGDRRLSRTSLATPYGAAAAYVRAVIDQFPDIEHANTCEDVIFMKRAVLFGGVLRVPVPLIYYRRGFGITSGGGNHAERRIRCCQSKLNGLPQVRADIRWCQSKRLVDHERLLECRRNARRYAIAGYAELQAYVAKSLRRRFAAWQVLCRASGLGKLSVVSLENTLMCLPTGFPRRLACGALQLYWNVRDYFRTRNVDVLAKSRSWVPWSSKEVAGQCAL